MNGSSAKQVENVKVSNRLASTPCIVVTSKYGWSANMERIMKSQALSSDGRASYMKGRKTLEINPRHPLIRELRERVGDGEDVRPPPPTPAGRDVADDQASEVAARVYEEGWRDPGTGRRTARARGVSLSFADGELRGCDESQVPADVARNAKLLYDTALLESGFMLDDPKAFSEKVFSIVKDSMDIPQDAPLEDIEIAEEEEEEEEVEAEEDVEVVEEFEEAEEAHDEL